MKPPPQQQQRESVGRLLRFVQDSELFHMERAIEEHKNKQHKQQQEQPHSLLRLSGEEEGAASRINVSATGGSAAIRVMNVDEKKPAPLPSKQSERLLTLADHKRIANLQSVLDAIDRASRSDPPRDDDAQRNMLTALTGALVTQMKSNCSATKDNCCVWGSEARKLHALLYWMATRGSQERGSSSSSTGSCVLELLLSWLSSEGSNSDKSQQLAAALVVFALVLRHRHHQLLTVPADNQSVHGIEQQSLLGGGVLSSAFVQKLIQLTRQGSVAVAAATESRGDRRIKLTKLGLVALEALVAVLCDQAAVWLSADEKKSNSSLPETQVFLEACEFAITSLQQYHGSTNRKKFFALALNQLSSYVEICQSSAQADAAQTDAAALEMLCWHWNASAMLLCTRSDAVIRIRKIKPPLSALKAEIPRWWSSVDDGDNTELLAARLRRLCVLLSVTTNSRGKNLLQELSQDLEAKGTLLIFLVRALESSMRGSHVVLLFDLASRVIRALVVYEEEEARPTLLDTSEDCRALLSLLLRTLKTAVASFDGRGTNSREARTLQQLQRLIADFMVQNGNLSLVTELHGYLGSADSSSILTALSLIPAIFHRQRSTKPFQQQHERLNTWRRELSPLIADLLAREDPVILQEALLCVSLLDCGYFTRLFTSLSEVGEQLSAIGLTLLFTSNEGAGGEYLEQITSAFIDSCRNGKVDQPFKAQQGSQIKSPNDWTSLSQTALSPQSPDLHSAHIQKMQEYQERVLALSSSSNGWIKVVKSPEARMQIVKVLLRKLFGAPRDPFSLRFLRELVAAGWVDGNGDDTTIFNTIMAEVIRQMKTQTRLTEKLLEDQSGSSAGAVEVLLFVRLAPVLVLRVLPRACFFDFDKQRKLHCDVEELSRLEEFVDNSNTAHDDDDTLTAVDRDLFHLLALQAIDPLEFKEVKMLSVEILANLPPQSVMPFIFAQLLAFLREEAPMIPATSFTESLYKPVLQNLQIPEYCGIITAKLMVYYLNRVINEELGSVYQDVTQVPFMLAILFQVLSIPCVPGNGGNERNLLADLQMGCMDCVALLILRHLGDSKRSSKSTTTATVSTSLLDVLVDWIIFDNAVAIQADDEPKAPSALVFAVEMMILSLVNSDPQQQSLPLQVRICGCNILLSIIGRLDENTLTAFKASRAIPRLVATVSMGSNQLREEVVAGCFQVLFSFIYKTADTISVKDVDDPQLISECFDLVIERLERSVNPQVCMNALKVVGAIMGKLPDFFGAVSEEKFKHLIRSLKMVRDQSSSSSPSQRPVSDFAQSLLNALTQA